MSPTSPHGQVHLELIIPALNEEQRIGKTVEAIAAVAARSAIDMRLIVVDNGSADATAECVDRASLRGLPIEVVGCRVRGKGAAVRAGVLHSSAAVVGYCDADLSTPPKFIEPAVSLLHAGYDVVIGSRRCQGARLAVRPPMLRRSGSWAFRQAARRYVGGTTDTQCGFKFFDGVVGRALFTRLETTGFAFDVELIARARQAGHAVAELPVIWADEPGSTFRPLRDGLSSFRDLAALRRSLAVVR